MSVITHRAQKVANHPAPAGVMRRAILRGARLVAAAAQAIAETRTQKAMLEAGLYLKRYSHSSKNDDDLPVVRPSATSKR
jgi:hypothetical protein